MSAKIASCKNQEYLVRTFKEAGVAINFGIDTTSSRVGTYSFEAEARCIVTNSIE